MKVRVVSSQLIELLPETDADNALLRQWGEGTARKASDGLKTNAEGPSTYTVSVQFTPYEKGNASNLIDPARKGVFSAPLPTYDSDVNYEVAEGPE